MKIKLRQPLSFSCIGQKDNQEDSLYPATGATASQRVFVLCDGMGGHAHGEVASGTVARALGSYIDAHLPQDCDEPYGQAQFEQALEAAYKALDPHDDGSADRALMGTTMTCLVLHGGGYLAAHIGDSRIYHIRPAAGGGVLYQSADHSLVNALLAAGELTPEEARTYPKRNVITRVMQPGVEHRAKAEVHSFADVRAGDYFFMCCDGVLEQLTNDRLCEILAEPGLSDEERLARIKAECDGRTRDNYTAWLVGVQSVEGEATGDAATSVLKAQAASRHDGGSQPTALQPEPVQPEPKRGRGPLMAIVIGIIAALAVVAVLLCVKPAGKPSAKQPAGIQKVVKPIQKQHL